MDVHSPWDAAIFTCIVVTFYSISWLREFTVPSLKKFTPSLNITPSHILCLKNHNGSEVIAFHLPKTRCTPTDNHLWANTPGPNDHFFAWRHPKELCPLTKSEVTDQIRSIVTQFSLLNLKGHCLHIGGPCITFSKAPPSMSSRWCTGGWATHLPCIYVITSSFWLHTCMSDLTQQSNSIASLCCHWGRRWAFSFFQGQSFTVHITGSFCMGLQLDQTVPQAFAHTTCQYIVHLSHTILCISHSYTTSLQLSNWYSQMIISICSPWRTILHLTSPGFGVLDSNDPVAVKHLLIVTPKFRKQLQELHG